MYTDKKYVLLILSLKENLKYTMTFSLQVDVLWIDPVLAMLM